MNPGAKNHMNHNLEWKFQKTKCGTKNSLPLEYKKLIEEKEKNADMHKESDACELKL